jgi:hypothetical protein
VAEKGALKRLTTWLRTLEARGQLEDEVPGVVIVLEKGRIWRASEGAVSDPATIDPRSPVIRSRQRPDGPR